MIRPLHPPLRFLLLFSFLFYFPSLINSQTTTTTTTAETEKQILLRLKSIWKDPPSLSSWSSNTSHCDWDGIQCTGGSVTGIQAANNNDIYGEIPAFICDLQNLSSLNVSNNYVSGVFPTGLYNCSNLEALDLSRNVFVGVIPTDIYRLPGRLRVLNLAGNNFTGDIPTSFVRFKQLQELDLDNNLFNVTFPVELGSISTLEHLTLARNAFAPRTIPSEFGNLTKLKYLWMSEANLIGGIPERFGNLTHLEHLDLSANSLTGGIPSGIWNMKNLTNVFLYYNSLSGEIKGPFGATGLRQIDLSMNKLSGSIPEDFGKFQSLEILFLYNNLLSGEIPAGIARIPTLYDVRLFNNSLTGVLPPEFGTYSQLYNFEVIGNRLSGELPQNFCAAGVLNSLILGKNNFTGRLPESLGTCKALQNLQVHNNGFYGDVPTGIWLLENLTTLLMQNNALTGELSDMLPRNLSRLEIWNNRFSGNIPSSARDLKVFIASNNNFSGVLPSDFSQMSQLQRLVLDRNQITGEISPSIGSLRFLTSFNLSGNQLTGSIPAAMGSMPVLTELDLSANRLSGEIPTELGALRLNFFNVSTNSLTGKIPQPLQNQAYDRSFLSNPGLCSSSNSPFKLNLPLCGSNPRGGSQELSKGLLTLFLILGILVFVTTVLLGRFVLRDFRRRKHGSDLASWKLTSFHSLDFSESSIVRGIKPENLVGSGGSGQVYRVALGNRAGELVAVKKICSRGKLDSDLEKEFQAEVEILGSIRHANIVKLLCCISGPDSKLFVYEYMENDSLYQWLHGKKCLSPPQPGDSGRLDWWTRLQIALGAARGLCYMHHDSSPPIVHRDVKSSNILLDAEFKPKVADFGLARMLLKSGEPHSVSTMAGSFGYMAPECGYSRKVNEKVDVYSFGVVLLELVTGRQASDGGGDSSLAEWAWRHCQEGNAVEDVLDEEMRRESPMFLDEMCAVLKLGLFCTGSLPSTRPSMKEVLQVLHRCAAAHGNFGDKSGGWEYDAAPLLRKQSGSRRKRCDGDHQDDEESGLASNV